MKSSYTLLIAEDDTDLARLMEFHLLRRGYRVRVVEDGYLAVKTAFEDPPDLLILDLMLPELHGFTVAQILKHSDKTGSIPILVVTAADTEEKRRASRCVGIDDFLGKPFALADLIQRVQGLLLRDEEVKTSPKASDCSTVHS